MFLISRLPAKRSSLTTVQCDVPQDVSFQHIQAHSSTFTYAESRDVATHCLT